MKHKTEISENSKKNKLFFSPKSIIIIIIPVLLRSMSPVFVKYAALSLTGSDFFYLVHNIYFYIVLLLLILRAVTWQIALKHAPLFIVYSFTGLVYVFLLVSGYFLFHEEVSITKVVAVFLILVGIVIISLDTK